MVRSGRRTSTKSKKNWRTTRGTEATKAVQRQTNTNAWILPLSAGTTAGASTVVVRSSRSGGAAEMEKGEDVPAIIVGANGRIGSALQAMGSGKDLLMGRDDPFPTSGEAAISGPIYVCTRNDVLSDVVAKTPEHRREDLVFLQNGMLAPWLASQGLGDKATQVLMYMAVAKLGEEPTDGITDMAPEGLTSATGKWANALATRLARGGMSCHVVDAQEFEKRMFEKLIWISSFMLVGAASLGQGATVGDVEQKKTEEVSALIDELACGVARAEGVAFDAQVPERLCAYARSVAHFPTAVKELTWRNGYFHTLTKAALSRGEPDPFPQHTALLESVGAVKPVPKFALLFDCDGVIVETEELHRLAYNESFDAFGCSISGKPVEWSVDYYDVLQNTVGGGKPKMRFFFGENGWPETKNGAAPATEAEQEALVDALQDRKTEAYKSIVERAAKPREGVVRLMEETANREDVALAICSAATRAGFEKVVNQALGEPLLSKFDEIIAGDDVSVKKPDPMIYNIASERLGVPRERCVVIEDSIVGLKAAVAAGMPCIITPTSSNSTTAEEFIKEGATAVVDTLGDDGQDAVTTQKLFPEVVLASA